MLVMNKGKNEKNQYHSEWKSIEYFGLNLTKVVRDLYTENVQVSREKKLKT
jgi:hypothetical protein